jgi:prepilin-type N-terminal cleavage/methylation domain-containing protein/prepilin-type processing-associated H-X9-DG protein
MLRKSSSQKYAGFTLIELLVVIAIIAILASILFPIFLAAKDKGNQGKCQSNCRQLGMAIMQYAQDYNEALPYPHNLSDLGIWWDGTWRERIQPYVKNRRILVCPVRTAFPAMTDVKYKYSIGHYGMSVALTHVPNVIPVYNEFGYTYLKDVTIPSQTIMISENRDGDWSGEPLSHYLIDSGGGYGHFYPYHNGGGIFIFCDGHAKWMKVEETERNGFYLWLKDKSKHVM